MATKNNLGNFVKSNLKLVVFDFDGVFTDNKVYVSDDGKEFVLQIGPAPGNFIEKHCIGSPDRGRCLHKLERAILVGQWIADQVVIVEQAGVVVPVFEV